MGEGSQMRSLVASKCLVAFCVLVLNGILVSCASNQSPLTTQQPGVVPSVAGPWEFVTTSSNGSVTGIEVALSEGTTIVGGVQQPNGQISADNAQITLVSLNPKTLDLTQFGGFCGSVTASNSIGPGTVTGPGAPISFTLTENGNVFTVNGTLSSDGGTLLNGTYTAQGSNSCTDPGGAITGKMVPKITGTYAGLLCPPLESPCQTSQDFSDSANGTASEGSSGVLTLNMVVSGTDNASLSLSGPVTGNAFFVQGTFNGQVISYWGYSELVSGSQGNAHSLYLMDVTDPASPAYAGTLQQQ
jgi:hypothetical protein